MRAFKITLCTNDPDHKVWWSSHVFVDGDVQEAIETAKRTWIKKHNEIYKKEITSTDIFVAVAEQLAEGE